MKAHTKEFKENIAKFGRELDSKITYTINGTTTELGTEQLNSVSPHYEGNILKSVMKQLDIDSNVEIPVGTEINYQFGVKVGNSYEYIDYGNYIVKEVEKQEDTRSYNITCYDKMLYSMQEYKMPIGKNLFTGLVKGVGLNATTGVETTSPNSATSDYIPVDFNVSSRYYLSGLTNTLRSFIGAYNADKQFLGRTGANDRTVILLANTSFPSGTPQGTGDIAYIRVIQYVHTSSTGTIDDVDNLTIQLEEGNQATTYEEHFSYPTTIKNYLKAICYDLSIPYQDSDFANYDKTIPSELYLDNNGKSLGYTYRDVLDEIAQATASTICMNANDKLEVRYINETVGKNLANIDSIIIGKAWNNANNNSRATILYIPIDMNVSYSLSANWTNTHITNIRAVFNHGPDNTSNNQVPSSYPFLNDRWEYVSIEILADTTFTNAMLDGVKILFCEGNDTEYEPYGDTIDEEYLKDVNVDFGEKYGPINTIVLSRSADSDSIYYPTTLPENPIELKISDNQIMNGNDRDTYLPAIYDKLNGLEYYINDYSSTGICYLDLCDKYNVKIGDKFYNCIMLNDEVNITQGLEENIYADLLEESVTEYTKADTTDRKINGAYIIANKASAEIEEITSRVDENEARVNAVETRQTATERTIEIKTKNIDDNGNITEVTTTNGYKFSADGLDIYNSDNSYHTLIDEDSTEYKDGSTTISITAKDGAGLRNLRTLEQYYYSFNNNNQQDILDTDNYDFVDERVEDDGEYVYATFYNGGDL